MIPAPFAYERAASVEDAVALLARHGDDAKVLAGGHSLIPLLRLRFARPSVLVDIGRVPGLDGVRDDGELSIGAMTRYCDVEASPLVAERAPLLAAAAAEVGDAQVRHRGTIGGSICHGDPASDVAAALLALGATVVVRGPAGERRIALEEVFVGFLETAIAPDEILVEVRVPVTSAPWAFEKFNRRAQDWAIVGCAVLAGSEPRVALVNMATTPRRAPLVEEALARGASAREAADLASEGTEPPSDANASAQFRRHLARVLVRRALERASR
ncbi:MAG TPA: xanthine dehydrogenase family protein subunit M [Acidimicrobiales bacterium]|nr:xanthine dehydrogenase family protein subunit M [Acidimicrobiales bacterium]